MLIHVQEVISLQKGLCLHHFWWDIVKTNLANDLNLWSNFHVDCSIAFVLLCEILLRIFLYQILVAESCPCLYILRPVTPESATLSTLCLGDTLEVEKMLSQSESSSSPQKKAKSVKNEPWEQLISRAVQHGGHLTSSGASKHKSKPDFFG